MKKHFLWISIFVLLITTAVCQAEVSLNPLWNTNWLCQVNNESSNASGGDAALYDQAYKLYEGKHYYEAHKLFVQSQYGEWERMAKKCVRRWPANGEVWRDSAQWMQDAKLTFKVQQPKDMAVFFRIYKDGQPVSYVFVGGTGEATVNLPGNVSYTIKDGVGSNWFGQEDTFGADGAYETMTFNDGKDATIYLASRYAYTISVNIDNAQGEDIGSRSEDWNNFTK